MSISGTIAAAFTLYFTGGNVAAASAAYSIGAGVDSVLNPTKVKNIGPRLADLSIQISSYGAAIPALYGTQRFAGNVIWSSDLIEAKTTTSDGKGGPSVSNTTYSYSVSFAVLLCEGTIHGIRRIWADNVLIYSNVDGVDATTTLASSGFAKSVTVYIGDETQLPSPLIESYVGVGNCPAYRGNARIEFEELQVGNFGNRTPQISCEVVSNGASSVAKTLFGEDANTVSGYAVNDVAAWVGKERCFLARQGGGTFPSALPNLVYRIDPSTGDSTLAGQFPNTTETAIPVVSQNAPMFADMIIVNPPDEGGDDYQRIQIYALLDSLVENDPNNVGAPILHIPYDDNGSTLLRGRLIVCYDDVTKLCAYALGNAPSNIYGSKVSLTTKRIPGMTLAVGASYPSYILHPHYEQGGSINAPSAQTLIDFRLYNGVMWMLTRDPGSGGTRTMSLHRFDQVSSGTIDTWLGPTADFSNSGYVWASLCVNEYGAFVWYEAANETCIYRFNPTGPATLLCDDANAGGSDPVMASGNTFFWTDGHIAVVGPTEAQLTGTDTSKFWLINFDTLAPNPVSLSSIVQAECDLHGVACDVTQLTDDVFGFLITKQSPSRVGIDYLASVFRFDQFEDAGIVRFVKRGGDPVRTLTLDDLGAYDAGSEAPDPLTIDRRQEIELPQAVTVNYTDRNNAYQQGSVTTHRLNTASEQAITLDVTAVALSADEAAKLADVSMMEAWVNRTSFKFATTYAHEDLTPTDVVLVNDGSDTYRIRLTKRTDQGGLIQWEGVADDALVLNSAATAQTSGADTISISQRADVDLELLDIPILQDADSDFGLYVATAPRGAQWVGANLYADDTTPIFFDTVSQRGTIGLTTNALADYAGPAFWDESSSVTVKVGGGQTLNSYSRDAVVGGQGNYLVGSEILGARNATQIAAGTYLLTGLLRGRRGTQSVGHAAYERFVLLSSAGMVRYDRAVTNYGISRRVLAVSIGRPFTSGTPKSIQKQYIGLQPFPPILLGYGQASNGDINFQWRAQTRLRADIHDAYGEPPGEISESYRVDVCNAGALAAPFRTLLVTAKTATYLKADRLSDMLNGLSLPAVFVVRQLSTNGGLPSAMSTPCTFDLGFTGVGVVFQLRSVGSNGSTTFSDASYYAKPVTHANPTSTTPVNIQSNKAFFPTALDDYLGCYSDAAFNVGTHDFIYEVRFNTTSTRTNATLIARGSGAADPGSFSVQMNESSSTDGRISYYNADFNGFGSPMMKSPSGTSYCDGVDHILQIVRSGSAWSMKVDGTTVATATYSGAIGALTGRALTIGENDVYTSRRLTGTISALTLTTS